MASSVRAAASIDSGGEGGGGKDQPVLKRRRLLDAGGPIEDDETARQKMRDARVYKIGVGGTEGEHDGFDPDNVGDIRSLQVFPDSSNASKTTYHTKPMGYFADIGDLPMMRWLYVNGADTRDEEITSFFPSIERCCSGIWMSVSGCFSTVLPGTLRGDPSAADLDLLVPHLTSRASGM